MKRILKSIGAVFLILAAAYPAEAQTRTAVFAPVDPGVRATALGGAFSALGEQPAALWWNPAGLYFQDSLALEGAYSSLYSLGLVKRTTLTLSGKKSFELPRFDGNRLVIDRDRTSGPAYGIGIQALSVDLDPESYSETALALGAAWGFGDRLVLGVALRGLLINSDLDDVGASGFNFGLGLIWAMSDRERLSLSAPHLISRVYWNFDSTERLPEIASLGWMRRWSETILTTAEVELREGEASPYKLAAGAEWWAVPERVALRGGYRLLRGGVSDIAAPTFGAGVRFLSLTFDYAFRVEPEGLDDTHRIGVLLDF